MQTEILEPYFDRKWYLESNADVRESGMDPLLHFTLYGAAERRDPSLLFDTNWYLETYADVGDSGMEPFQHFIVRGLSERRNPNPFFDTAWYLTRYEEARTSELDPLLHFIQIGLDEDFDPSPYFDTRWYRNNNLDIVGSTLRPFEHFLKYGLREGRHPSPDFGYVHPVTDARIMLAETFRPSAEIALLITHAPDGTLKPHVAHYIASLARHGIQTVLIAAADRPFWDADRAVAAGASGIYVRENVGFDFAAWAHVVKRHPELLQAEILYLLNDSVIGPFNDQSFGAVIARVRESSAAVIGLTDSYESTWHIQSYFLALKRDALATPVVQDFFRSIMSYPTKLRVITEYELRYGRLFTTAGIACEALFPTASTFTKNPHIYQWKDLIDRGSPFLKITTIRDIHPFLDARDWRDVAASKGYDVALADPILHPHRAYSTRDGSTAEKSDVEEFSPVAYIALNPDLDHTDLDPYHHYITQGRRDGRQTHLPNMAALRANGAIDPDRETVLLVSHDGLRGGAPILVYNLVKHLVGRYNVVVLFLASGPIMEACGGIGAVVIGPIPLNGQPHVADYLVKSIVALAPLKFAIVNTVISRFVLPALAKHHVPTVTLIHEFAAYIRPRGAFTDVVFWSGQVVFSTEMTRENAMDECPGVTGDAFLILPQGVCEVPADPDLDTARKYREGDRVAAAMRSGTGSSRGPLVIGAGFVEYRKGVDLFIGAAAIMAAAEPEKDWRFVWIGRGYRPEEDFYSMFLADQISRSGLAGRMVFLDEVSDLSTVYEGADLLMLTSRLDPLPNVALDALAAGLPIVCFDGTGGIAKVLRDSGLAQACIAGYLDVRDLAEKAASSMRTQQVHDGLSSASRKIAADVFDMATYVSRIERTARDAGEAMARERADAATILGSGTFDGAYCFFGRGKRSGPADEILEYVRSWTTGLRLRKPCPGFHPGIYRERNFSEGVHDDPYAHYLRSDRPNGPWSSQVIRPNLRRETRPTPTGIGLHIHAYYVDLLDDLVARLRINRTRPDLFISVAREQDVDDVWRKLSSVADTVRAVTVVPNRGRDLGPFFTEFGVKLAADYDIVGHVHTKKTLDIQDRSVVERWNDFLLENVIGGRHPMLDAIVAEMVADETIGIVFPDDPHVIGWGASRAHAETLWQASFDSPMPEQFLFPVGSMFWARTAALSPVLDMKFSWGDYPPEPLPYDGSMLHGLERFFGPMVVEQGFRICTSHVDGVTR